MPQEIKTARWLERQAKNPSRKRITINMLESDLIALSVVAHKNLVTSASYARDMILRNLRRELPELYRKRKIA